MERRLGTSEMPKAGGNVGLSARLRNWNAGEVERIQEKVSIGLLTTALLLFVAFHFLPDSGGGQAGWHIWPGMVGALLREPGHLPLNRFGAVIIASVLNFSLLIVVSPFLSKVWTASRLAWCFATISSGLSIAGFWWVIVASDSIHEPGLGGWCLIFAPILNFIGLFVARGSSPKRGISPSESGESAG